MKVYLLAFLFILRVAGSGYAQPLRIAVAANAQFVVKTLQADFEKKTGIKSEIISGSSGKLTAQIKNGAPYDVFLSADMEYPVNLFKAGFGRSRPKVYALGSLIVCSTADMALKDWPALIRNTQLNKIALANPTLAPYGKAAKEALRHYGLWEKVASNLVFGESIAQVNTYILSGAVPLGFTSEALIYENPAKNKLQWVRVDPTVFPPIQQGMVVLSHAKKENYAKAMKFYTYLSSPAAKQLLKQNGYQVP